jgi:valyl-tRNA synthetase
MHDVPFHNVFLTGIVRDKLGRKMSKSLGTSPDPLDLIAKYGADAVRLGMMLCTSAGNDILFDESQVEQGRNFCNKVWNAYRLTEMWKVEDKPAPEVNKLAVSWFKAKLSEAVASVEDHYAKYRISDAIMTTYKLFWDDFCAWYLELVKPAFGEAMDRETFNATIGFFETLLKMLHPFTPFITEELWQHIAERKDGETIMFAATPKAEPFDAKVIEDFNIAAGTVVELRALRQKKNISPKEALQLRFKGALPASMTPVIEKMANICDIAAADESTSGESFMVGTVQFFVPLEGMIDVEAEREKILAEINRYEGFLKGVNAKLGNERFVANAPAAVVENERKKQSDATQKLAALKDRLAKL